MRVVPKYHLHDTFNLYLKRMDNNWTDDCFVLAIYRDNRLGQFDVPLIYDICVDNGSTIGYRYFIVKNPTKGILHSALSSQFKIPYSGRNPDATISAFYEKYPDFEICSPGFENPRACKKWWKNNRSKIDRQLSVPYKLWESHIVLSVSFCYW